MKKINARFRGYLPVIVDVETAGTNPQTDALLEMAIVFVEYDDQGSLVRGETHAYHIEPFDGANLDPESLKFNKIDPFHPFRFAIPEEEALQQGFKQIKAALKKFKCQRAFLVGHNAWFDLLFIKAAVARCQFKKMPFHAFTSLDTATLGGLAYGQTVLVKACEAAGISFDQNEAHSAIYDAEKTADLFCEIVNQFGDAIKAP